MSSLLTLGQKKQGCFHLCSWLSVCVQQYLLDEFQAQLCGRMDKKEHGADSDWSTWEKQLYLWGWPASAELKGSVVNWRVTALLSSKTHVGRKNKCWSRAEAIITITHLNHPASNENAAPGQLRPINDQVHWQEVDKYSAAVHWLPAIWRLRTNYFAMHLKQKGCFGVFLLFTMVIRIYSFPNDQSRAHPTIRGGKRRLHIDSPHGVGSRGLVYTGYSEDRDGATTSEGMPGQAPTPSTASTPTDRRFKNRVKLGQSEGKWMYFPPGPSNEACAKGQITPVTQGKFYIPGEPEADVPNVGYQADSADPGRFFPESYFFLFCLFFLMGSKDPGITKRKWNYLYHQF